MNHKIERIVGASFSFGAIFTLYLYLKITEQIPGPGWGILNLIDSCMVKAFHILKIGVPVLILVTFVYLYIKKLRERQENERQEKERQYEIYHHEERKKEEGILARFQSIEAKLQKLNDEFHQMNRSKTDFTESVLQDFL
jgi:hypothetical protein